MAKDKTKDKPTKEAKAEKAAAPEFKFGVSDIAEKLGIKEASVRVQLRNKGIEKAGKSYGWDSKSDLNEVIDQLKTEKPEKPAKEKKAAKPDKADKKKAKKSKDEDDD